jgi:hypothetical protein
MSGRFFALLALLAALITAATYFYTTETQETLSDPVLTDLERTSLVHGWPWGYFAEVTDLVRQSENYVAVMEYKELRLEMLGQTYLLWFVVSLILSSLLLVVAGSGRGRGSTLVLTESQSQPHEKPGRSQASPRPHQRVTDQTKD